MPLFYDSFKKPCGDGGLPLFDNRGVKAVMLEFPLVILGENSDSLPVPLSSSALHPVEVAFRRGLSIVLPQRTIKLKTKTNACVITNPDPQNSKNATSRPAGRTLVGEWLCSGGQSFS